MTVIGILMDYRRYNLVIIGVDMCVNMCDANYSKCYIYGYRLIQANLIHREINVHNSQCT